MARTIVVAQRTLESASLEFAAGELWREGDDLVLVHVAQVLPPSSVTLHSAPQTTFSVDPDVDPAALTQKVTRAIKSRVLAKVEVDDEVAGPRVTLKVVLQPSQEWEAALVREAADGMITAAREAGASVLVLAREPAAEGGNGAGSGAERALGALGKRLEAPTLTQEVVARSGALPVVLVPAGYGAQREGSASASAGGGGSEAVAPQGA